MCTVQSTLRFVHGNKHGATILVFEFIIHSLSCTLSKYQKMLMPCVPAEQAAKS